MLDTTYFEAVEQIDWGAQGKVYAFGYYGGKISHLPRLLPILPRCQTYVEPFGGSGAVLLNRSPSPVEVYNDLDKDVVTFFKVLRERPDELSRQIELTPYSRFEFAQSCERREDLSELERARRFYVRIGQSRSGFPDPSPGQWSYCVGDSRRDMSSAVSAWQSLHPRLAGVARRLLNVQIECEPALKLIERYDTPETLFYLDPPYVLSTRSAHELIYTHEMTDGDHRALAERMHQCKGKVAISGYASTLYDELYKDWYVTTWGARTENSGNGVRAHRTEVLWTNYNPQSFNEALFDHLPLFAGLTA